MLYFSYGLKVFDPDHDSCVAKELDGEGQRKV